MSIALRNKRTPGSVCIAAAIKPLITDEGERMKLQLVNVLKKVSLLCAILLVTVVASAQGQSLENRIKAQVPFDFSIGDKRLPSGKYSVGRARQNSDDVVLSIEDEDGVSMALQMSIPVLTGSPRSRTTLVFHRYGDQYFLYQVWPAGALTGRQFLKSRSEREAQETLAANPTVGKTTANIPVQTVTIIIGALQ